MTHLFGKPAERMCRACGCTESDACITDAGACCWVLLDVETPTGICSACAVEMAWDPAVMATAWMPAIHASIIGNSPSGLEPANHGDAT